MKILACSYCVSSGFIISGSTEARSPGHSGNQRFVEAFRAMRSEAARTLHADHFGGGTRAAHSYMKVRPTSYHPGRPPPVFELALSRLFDLANRLPQPGDPAPSGRVDLEVRVGSQVLVVLDHHLGQSP